MADSGTPADGRDDDVRTVATYRVSEGRAGQRLDLFLKECIPKLSREGIQRAIRARVELPSRRGRPKPSLVVREGDVVVLTERVSGEPPIPDAQIPTLLHVDAQLVAVDKPAGLPVHASRQTVKSHLIGWLRERFDDSLALAHRIDRETSGVVLSTRTTAAARALANDFANGNLHKEYLALVEGEPPERFSCDLPIGADSSSKIFVKQWVDTKESRPCRTTFVRERTIAGRLSLVRAYPESGRRHQIRVHLAALGFPVVGDKLYARGDRMFLRYITWGMDESMIRELGAARHLLHAAVLEITHPETALPLRIVAPLPLDFRAALGDGGG